MALRRHTRVLSHDSLRGRGTGTAGVHSAALYIAARLRELGARTLDGEPATNDGDYLLPVPLIRADVGDATVTLAEGSVLRHGQGFVVGRVGRAGLRDADGRIVRLGADSIATEGAWLLLDRGPGESAARWLPVWREAGAVGLIIVLASEEAVDGWHRQLGDVRWQLAHGPPDPIWQPDLPILMVGPALAARITTSRSSIAFRPNERIDTVTDFNVAGVLPGNAPAAEPIVLTAHYDHLGTRLARSAREDMPGAGGGGDSIYNGFSDNAAGVAMLLAMAESIAPVPPPRPIVFLFPAAEEVGLLGSIQFVRSHPRLTERVHAVVNLDAGAPPAPPTRWRLAAGTRSGAGEIAATVVREHGWAYRADAGSPNSDHWPFVAHGVPAVFLIPDGGYEGVDEAGVRRLTERWDHYHQPQDEWHPDFPFSGLARYATLAREIVYALADAENMQ